MSGEAPAVDLSYSEFSSATNVQDFYKDLMRSSVQRAQAEGAAPPTLGVTVPLPGVASAHEYLQAMTGLADTERVRKQHMSYDTPGTPLEASYTQRRYDFIAGSEAIKRRAYDDATGGYMRPGAGAKGNVTVGVGFNMDRPDAKDVMSHALGFDDATFQSVYSGQRALSDLEVRKLFEYTAEEAESIVTNKLGKDVPLKEHQRLALVSLAFNSPSLIGPRIVDAIKNNKTVAALKEILFNSNRRRSAGLARRRYREAHMFNGPSASEGLPALQDYLAQIEGGETA